MPIHQIAHLNDGWYGNQASWIAKTPAAWAEIDLGDVYTISQVRLSNDQIKQFSDRKPVDYRILVATKYDADSAAATWKPVAEVSGEPLLGVRDSPSLACPARWVRVQIVKSEPNEPRLDEIQIFEAQPLAAQELRRGNRKPAASHAQACDWRIDDLPGLEGLPGRSGQAAAGQLCRRRGLS